MTVSIHDFISTTDRCGAACSERYSEDFLEAYSLGTQKGAEAVDFEQHLTLCATCQVRLAEVERWIQLLRKASTEAQA